VSVAVDAVVESLYVVLAEPAPESAERGETSNTRAKETLDDDREALGLGAFGAI
jgi:hypothetical protein